MKITVSPRYEKNTWERKFIDYQVANSRLNTQDGAQKSLENYAVGQKGYSPWT